MGRLAAAETKSLQATSAGTSIDCGKGFKRATVFQGAERVPWPALAAFTASCVAIELFAPHESNQLEVVVSICQEVVKRTIHEILASHI